MKCAVRSGQLQRIDRQRMLDTAVAYFLAGERCVLNLTFGRYGTHYLGAPVVTNYAFAIELMLKLLAFNPNSAPRRGHSLISLFESLPQDVQDAISKEDPLLGARTTAEVFRENANAFEHWRYAYEHKDLVSSYNDLRHLFVACHRAFRTLNPDHASVFERNFGCFDPDPDWAWYEMELKEFSLK